MTITIEQLMTQIQDYPERSDVEDDFKGVLQFVQDNYPYLYQEIALFLTDVEAAPGLVPGSGEWDDLKEGDEVMLTFPTKTGCERYRVLDFSPERDLLTVHVVGYFWRRRTLCKGSFRRYMTLHWTIPNETITD